MLNIYETVRAGMFFNKFEVDDILFVEYSCPIEDESTGIWSQSDYLVHVLSGKKTWRTAQGEWTITAGKTVFIKKGAAIIDQYFDDEFCMLGFFVSDDFIKNTVQEYAGNIQIAAESSSSLNSAMEVKNDDKLNAYYQSLLPYFSGLEKPTKELLILKMKELILNILTSPQNASLASYLYSLINSDKPAIKEVMDVNFCFNLRLEDYAKLCHRSLSSFKRDFNKYFGISPGKWLLNKRLEYAAILLKNENLSISQVAFECGFEDLSHFSRVFKDKYNLSPISFRKETIH